MNPLSETPESHVNGMTTPARPPSAALKAKIRPKKAPELQTIERRNWLIHLHYVRKEFELCKQLIREQLDETRGMCEYANYVQGLILRQEGKIQESFELFQLCNILNPSSIENIKQMARALFLLGRHKLAVEAYIQAENKCDKADWEIHHNLGVCYMHLKEYDNAREQLIFALEQNKHHQTFAMLAKLYLLENDVASSINTYRAAIESCLKARVIFMVWSHQDFDVALAKYRVAAQSIPESPPLWNNIAMCFFGKKKYVAAISCLKRANYLAPFDWKILYNLGLVHLTMQQYTSAFHFLSAAVNLRPTKGHIFMLLAISLTYLDDEENARQAYEQAVSLESRDPSVCLNYAVFLQNHDDAEGARRMINEFEARVVRFRQATGADLDTEVMEIGAKLAAILGVSGSVFQKRSGRTMLEAEDETVLPSEKLIITKDADQDGGETPQDADNTLNPPENSTLLVPSTHNPELHDPPAETEAPDQEATPLKSEQEEQDPMASEQEEQDPDTLEGPLEDSPENDEADKYQDEDLV
ncbi:Bardet-Biedl syndrome 4 protein-like isoform X4 [Macrobrachium rosenbergii]